MQSPLYTNCSSRAIFGLMKQLALYQTKRVHLAIMQPAWGLLPKILSGQKTIEMRWYKTRQRPWGEIEAGDMLYFKDAGQPVTARAEVGKVVEYDNLDAGRIRDLLNEYGQAAGFEAKEMPEIARRFNCKRYCIIIYLKKAQKIKPFEINKAGFGSQTAWLVLDDINRIKRTVVSQPKLLSR